MKNMNWFCENKISFEWKYWMTLHANWIEFILNWIKILLEWIQIPKFDSNSTKFNLTIGLKLNMSCTALSRCIYVYNYTSTYTFVKKHTHT
jgi:hypothetical protein